MSGRILIAEDERRIAAFLERGLQAAGYSTTVAGDGVTAVLMVLTGEFDLLILDIGLPRKDGFQVLRDVRARDTKLPIIILTARDSARDAVTGFQGGADDYVRKPFPFEELLARVEARLRKAPDPLATVLEVGGAKLDLHGRDVLVDGRRHELTAREFALAEAFFRHPAQVLSREQLLSMVWGYEHDTRSNIVDVYVGYLRKKIGTERIVGIRGMGYRLEVL